MIKHLAETFLRFISKLASVCTEDLERNVFENYTSSENYASKIITPYFLFSILNSMILWIVLGHQCAYTDDPARHNATTTAGTQLIPNLSLHWLTSWWARWRLISSVSRLYNRLFRHRSKKTSKLRVTGLCEGNPPETGGFPSQRASNADLFFHLMPSSWHASSKLF